MFLTYMKPIITFVLRSAILTINPEMIVFKDLISVEQAENLILNFKKKFK